MRSIIIRHLDDEKEKGGGMRATIITLSILMISLTITSFAFDGQRQGFILGAGIGPAYTSFHEEGSYKFCSPYDDGEYEIDHEGIGLQYSVRAGYAPIDRLAVYAFGKDISFEYEDYAYLSGVELCKDSYLYTTGFLGLGVVCYHKPDHPSFYLKGEAAYPISNSSFIQPDFSHGSQPGFSLCFGLGFEYARNWSAELDATWAKTSEKRGNGYFCLQNIEINCYSVGLTINALGY